LRDLDQLVLLAASRSENKIKRFALDGKYPGLIELPGVYTALCWSKGNGTGKKLGRSGFVIVLDKHNRVVSCPGGSEPVYQDGKLQPLSQSGDSPFIYAHDLCVDTDDNIYVCQWNSDSTYLVKLERVTRGYPHRFHL